MASSSSPLPSEETVTVSIPRSALIVVAPPPSHVDQTTVSAVVGLDRKAYLRHCRAGAWPVTRSGKKLIARTLDVQAFLDKHARMLAKTRPPAKLQGPAEFTEMPLPKGVRRAS